MFTINLIVIVIFFGTLGYSLMFSPKKSFYNLYLPLLFFLPSNFRADLPGLPDTTPAETVLLASGLIYFFTGFHSYRFSVIDILLIIYSLICILSDANSISPIANINTEGTEQVLTVLLPYIFAKTYVGLHREEVKFSKRFVFIIFLICLTLPYEIRMMASPIKQFLRQIYTFPPDIELVIRYGFKRFDGPFFHAILAGIILAVAFLINTWLTRNNLWKKIHSPFMKYYPYFIGGLIFLALIFTFARAPLYSLILAFSLALVGYTPNSFKTILFGCVGTLLAITVVYSLVAPYFIENATVFSGAEDWNTFSYRVTLLNKYWDVVLVHPLLGWGNEGWPVMDNLLSIDNHYLWMSLRHGLIIVYILLAFMILTVIELIWKGLQIKDIYNRSLYFTLAGAIMIMLIVLSTVYLGGQTQSLLFLILGWAQGLMKTKYREVKSA